MAIYKIIYGGSSCTLAVGKMINSQYELYSSEWFCCKMIPYFLSLFNYRHAKLLNSLNITKSSLSEVKLEM